MLEPPIFVSVVLPCLNESASIKNLIEQILKIDSFYKEIVVVDDGSSDGTDQIVESLTKLDSNVILVQTGRRLGLAESILLGISKAKHRYIAVMDTDGMHNPVYLTHMVEESKKITGMVIASRYVAGGGMKGALYPHLSSLVNKIVKEITKSQINDQLCGYFVSERDLLLAIPPEYFRGFGEYFIRIIGHLENNGKRIQEIGTLHEVRAGGKRKSKRLRMLTMYVKTAIQVRTVKKSSILNQFHELEYLDE